VAVINKQNIKELFPLLADSVHYIKRRKNELCALNRHLARKRFQKNNEQINRGRIKVVFICQYIPAWSKNKQLYETLKKDKLFEVMLLCIPNRVSANRLEDPDNMSNDVYDYFSSRGYEEAVNALIGKDKWFELKTWRPDYVFYNRYDRPMPLQYTSSIVSCYAKICLIIYGVALLRLDDYLIDKTFMSNTFCFFAESKGIKNEFIRWNRILCKQGLSNAYLCGIAAVENAIKAKDDPCPAWTFSKNDFRIIYAPRWTTDLSWGGSSFMKYKDTFTRMADKQSDIDILIRPHPLMFDNFIKLGIMNEKDVNEYKTGCEERSNIRVDKEKEYQSTFWNSSLLVCDFSSMIIEYFVTGKPIIFVSYSEKIEYNDIMHLMLDGCYIVNNEDELKQTINDLKNGIDPLAEVRWQVINNELLGSLNASEKMKQVLIENYKK